MSPNHYNLTLSRRRYCLILLLASLGLIAIHSGLYVYNYQVEELPWLLLQLFDLDEENNIPTWFSSFLLFNCSVVLYVSAHGVNNKFRLQWFLLAVGFFILAIDEVAGIHESFNSSIEMNWAIVGGGLVAVIGIIFIPFLMSLERRLAALFLLSGSIFVGGAIGVELLAEDMDVDTLVYTFSTAIEEGLEMIGALLFLAVNLSEMKKGDTIAIAVE